MHYRIELPRRRYALFSSILRGDYLVVIKEADFDTAEKWGDFVRWFGGVKDPVVRSQ